MSLSINTNLMAVNTARTLNAHYGRLATSTQRLSSGLRINSASDDAASLAIRELMRADVAALNQGVRNANDAISMIQIADGALAIIDEKLIRMKELAEQASTGTYNSTQRLMIDSEYQAMAAEITRIANATDFNGIQLLDGSLNGRHEGSEINSKGELKIHFGLGNDSAEDYYYINIGNCTATALGLGSHDTWSEMCEIAANTYKSEMTSYYQVNNPERLKYIDKETEGFIMALNDIAVPRDTAEYNNFLATIWDGNINNGEFLLPKDEIWNSKYNFPLSYDEYMSLSDDGKNYVRFILGKCALYNYGNSYCTAPNSFKLGDFGIQPNVSVNIENKPFFPDDNDVDGTFKMDNGRPLDFPDQHVINNIGKAIYETTKSFTFNEGGIETQEKAQNALVAIEKAIVSKDKIRAHLGALQNRLENTVSNLEIISKSKIETS